MAIRTATETAMGMATALQGNGGGGAVKRAPEEGEMEVIAVARLEPPR
ncbi:MAG: hypothetical protein R2849_15335 [Thermomicrobiales bacterium]